MSVQNKVVYLHQSSKEKQQFNTAADSLNTGLNKMKKVAIRDRKVNGKQFAYILDDVLTGEQFEGLTDAEKINVFLQQFNEEFNYEYNRRCYPNPAARIGEWLQGLPTGINIDYIHCDIVARLESFGIRISYLRNGDWDARTYGMINDWFKMCGLRIIQAAEILGVNTNSLYKF